MIIHVVKPGETVVSIAAQYGVLPDLLSLANGVGGQSLVPGQTLVVRYPAGILTVQPGDTLYSIALREGVSVLQLWRCNPWLWGTERLYPGQTLVTGYQQEQQSTLLVTGYAYPYIREDLLRQTLPYLSACIPFTYGFTPEGRLLPLGDGALLTLARQYGAESWMHLSTLTEEGGFSSALAEALLQNDAARAQLAAEIAAQMAEKGYAGLDVDFEYLPGQSAAAYADFIRQLREALSPGGAPVTVALAPKTSAGQAGLLYEGHDYAALGAAADYCLLMTYEWGYAYSAPMAVSPIPKIRQVLDYAITAIPAKSCCWGSPAMATTGLCPIRRARPGPEASAVSRPSRSPGSTGRRFSLTRRPKPPISAIRRRSRRMRSGLKTLAPSGPSWGWRRNMGWQGSATGT